MAFLQCTNLKKAFGGLNAIDGVELTVNKGEVLGLIGPNGAGKTTLVNLLTGEIAPTDGQILYDGKDISGLSPFQRCELGFARTFQVPRPFASMSIRENVMVGARFGKSGRGADGSRCGRLVADVLKATKLDQIAENFPTTLSTAGLKRLEVARCLAAEPDILCLDEPLGGLNPVETEEALTLIRSLKQQGITIVFIEHIVKAVTAVSDRIVVLARGRKLAEGSPAEIISDEKVQKAYLGDVGGALKRRASLSGARAQRLGAERI